MEIIKEKIDREFFLDLVINKQEISQIMNGQMVSLEFFLEDHLVNLGVRQPVEGEKYAS